MKNKYEIQETDYGVTWINVLQKNSRPASYSQYLKDKK